MESTVIDWVIAIGTFVTIGMVIVLVWSVQKQKKQLLVSNFEVISDFIGADKTRYARRILLNHYESVVSNEFFEKFPKGETNKDFDDYNEWAKLVGSIYNRVGFLLKQDNEIKEKIITYHGFTIGIMWIMFKRFMKMWQEHDKLKEYTELQEIGDLCYCEWKDRINKFLENKKEQNKNKKQFDWFIEKRKSPLEW